MKKLILTLTGAALFAFALNGAAIADPLIGTFTFSGTGHLTGPTGFGLAEATGFDSVDVTITMVNGTLDFALNTGDKLTLNNPWLFADPTTDSWSVGALNFTGQTNTWVTPNTGVVVVSGLLSGIDGYDSYVNFSFSGFDGSGTVSLSGMVWSGANADYGFYNTPDGGVTAAMLIAGLASLGLISRRRLAA
jgi:hypothetical protein